MPPGGAWQLPRYGIMYLSLSWLSPVVWFPLFKQRSLFKEEENGREED